MAQRGAAHSNWKGGLNRYTVDSEAAPGVGCWIWRGATSTGYGRARLPGRNGERGKYALVHRVLFEDRFGPVPAGLDLDHLCRARACVNPAHLEAVTRRTNIVRGISPIATHAQKTHRAHGHPLSGPNLYQTAHQRYCRTCRKNTYEKRKGNNGSHS